MTPKAKGGSTRKVAIVVSRFNEFITKDLLAACLAELTRAGMPKSQMVISWVPGSFEIPVVALAYAKRKDISGVICLGAVIRGETLHFELVANAAAEGIARVSLMTNKPVIFGVITTDTVQQAHKRSLKKGENKGREAARTFLKMVEIMISVKNRKGH